MSQQQQQQQQALHALDPLREQLYVLNRNYFYFIYSIL